MQIRKTSALVSLLAAAGLAATMGATPATAAAAQHHPAHQKHGLGLNIAGLKAAKAAKHAHANSALPVHPLGTAKAPSSGDLTQYANTPGDQGQVGSCVTWATGYTGYGVLMNEQGIDGGPMAPMFIYSQIAKGNDQGTWASVALPMEQKQGIDTKSDYWQGDFDYTTQPDQNEKANAAHYKLSGYTELSTSGNAAKTDIENAISQGEPVAIGFTVHQSFMDLNSSTASDYSYLPGDSNSDPVVGGHEVTIVAYNEQGVKIENSWGSSWGDSGFVTVPWSFFNTGDVDEVNAMGKLVQS
ncbi:C1 family peptidase [Amycolatopsis rubida]|uniref:C1 family peptidase n=1 Tax=Amycolatopsis rubida TaxID=112413 RepID=A0A1I5NM38_9PSEU|nr:MULTISPECIES: C1 family peptidase [Amycolatopsis]MYW97011.1 peptidase [Amycolatopsis rubida]NEC61996.1 C1 family peptidase [Amycolatopsis rubida]OAP21462.1 Papain family cysteine protease [Amycolatopsis sp. M39]SFP22844.1 Papain family cysteine protease [Amycolatopsis rubida]